MEHGKHFAFNDYFIFMFLKIYRNVADRYLYLVGCIRQHGFSLVMLRHL